MKLTFPYLLLSQVIRGRPLPSTWKVILEASHHSPWSDRPQIMSTELEAPS